MPRHSLVLVSGAALALSACSAGSEPLPDGAIARVEQSIRGDLVWVDQFGAPGDQESRSTATSPTGEIGVAGNFRNAISIGATTLVATSDLDVFVAKLWPGGAPIWQRGLSDPGGVGNEIAGNIAFDPTSGEMVLVGAFDGALAFGGALHASAGAQDVFVAKLDASGAPLWLKRFGDANLQYARGVAVHGDGSIVITGYSASPIDFGGGPVPPGLFVAKLSAAGGALWSQGFTGALAPEANGVAINGLGEIAVTGVFSLPVDFGGGSLVPAARGDGFLVKFSAAGAHLWSQSFGGGSEEGGKDVAFDQDGNVIVTGTFAGGPFQVGGFTFAHDPFVTDWGFVAKFDACGKSLWARSYENGHSSPSAVTIDPNNNVFVTGVFSFPVNFGPATLVDSGGTDLFLVQHDSTGRTVMAQRYGGAGSDRGHDLTIASDLHVVVAGAFADHIDFSRMGTGPLWTSLGGRDAFLTMIEGDTTTGRSGGLCVEGPPVRPTCQPSCVASVCAADAYCCNTAWDGLCVAAVPALCGLSCCPHSPTVAGGPLNASCCPCVAAICGADPFCCITAWDALCVAAAAGAGCTC